MKDYGEELKKMSPEKRRIGLLGGPCRGEFCELCRSVFDGQEYRDWLAQTYNCGEPLQCPRGLKLLNAHVGVNVPKRKPKSDGPISNKAARPVGGCKGCRGL